MRSGEQSRALAPVIGVTGRRYPAEHIYPSDTAALGGIALDAFFQPYARALAEAGAAVVFLPRESAADELVRRLDGVLLSGGQDVHPVRYGGTITPETTELDAGQDDFDLALARAAIERGVPLLGTCRGHEVLNVAMGGTLHDHGRPSHNVRAHPVSRRTHSVRFEEGSLVHEVYGARTEVNSLHHQAIDRLAAGVQASGWADDDMVEAIEVPGACAVGVQWHPEFHAGGDPILNWLVDAARERTAAGHGAAA